MCKCTEQIPDCPEGKRLFRISDRLLELAGCSGIIHLSQTLQVEINREVDQSIETYTKHAKENNDVKP